MFLPPRLLTIDITNITFNRTWTSGASTDQWYGLPYRWNVTFAVSPQAHSSDVSATKFYYNGLDVAVGDWFSDIASGVAMQIVSITSANASTVSVVAEDIDRFNTFTDPTGNGNGVVSTGAGYLFALGDDGLPILTPMSSVATTLSRNLAWQNDLQSRFRYRNLQRSYYRVYQSGNTFAVGDPVAILANGTFMKASATSSTVLSILGTVSDINTPGAGWFCIRLKARLITNVSPALPGTAGQLIYANSAGVLSITPPAIWAVPIYLQIGTNSALLLDRGINTATALGYSSQNYVAPTIAAAHALILNAGDQVYVEDSGDGTWQQLLQTGSTLVVLASQQSAVSNADTLTTTLNAATTGTISLGIVSANHAITQVVVTVLTAFDPAATLSVGTSGASSGLVANTQVDLSTAGTYMIECAVPYGASTQINAYLSAPNGTAGQATVSISFS